MCLLIKINVIQQECENTKQKCKMNSWSDMNIGQKKWQKQIVINTRWKIKWHKPKSTKKLEKLKVQKHELQEI